MTPGLRAACPHCDAMFVLTEEHLSAREGLVRCGACRQIFNAKWHLAEQAEAVSVSVDGAGPAMGDAGDDFHSPAHRWGRGRRGRSEPVLDAAAAESEADAHHLTGTQDGVAARRAEPGFDADAGHPDDASAEYNAAETAHATPDTPTIPRSGPINMSGVDHYINPRPNPLVSLSWFMLGLGLVLLLGGQVRYFFVEAYAQHEYYRPYLAGFCEIAACELPPRQDANRFTLTHTKIDLHPHEPGAIKVTVKLVNEATFAQPYPNLQLTLTDRDGWVVGRRTFAPRQYLEPGQPNVLGSGELGAARFDLARPHEKAVGFEVNIVERPASS